MRDYKKYSPLKKTLSHIKNIIVELENLKYEQSGHS